ncbi:MAG: phosphopantothenoylcysteine decarboxylase domain-containing protein [Limisphaerales bacterium]
MHCIITAGPTYEPLDEVRRLTNFSTGKLGSELANFLTKRGHEVELLLGESATWCGEQKAKKIQRFTSTQDLCDRLEKLASPEIDAVLHAAAVSDFKLGKTWMRDEKGELVEIKSAKISTRDGTMLAELVPTAKIITRLRAWFPNACIVGWKYEMEGEQKSVQEKALRQLDDNNTDACVMNGRAWGSGFGLYLRLQSKDALVSNLKDANALYEGLYTFLKHFGSAR